MNNKLTSIKKVKEWVDAEISRLNGRLNETNTDQEYNSLCGSLLTLRKLKEKL